MSNNFIAKSLSAHATWSIIKPHSTFKNRQVLNTCHVPNPRPLAIYSGGYRIPKTKSSLQRIHSLVGNRETHNQF